MHAKEKAAVMVTQLAAASLGAPLAFSDATGVAETVTSLASNPEIEFGAAWELDSEHPGALGAQLGVLSRGKGALAPPRAIPTELRSRFTATHVVVEAPVKDPNGKLVGATQVAFSTAREEAMIAEVERHVLRLSMGSALGLIVILSLASRLVVVRPLRRLTRAAADLKRGEKPQLSITSRDEIGELVQNFLAMSVAIESREQRIRDRNRDMQRILDNADEAFITVSRAGVMSDERSKILETWFGPAQGSNFLEYFSRISPERCDLMALSFEALNDEFLPIELILDQFPHSFVRGGRHFQLRYRAISGQNDSFESLLIVVRDATEAVERDRAARREKEMLAIFRQLMTDPEGWSEFFETGSQMVQRLAGAGPLDEIITRRLVHTLKGNCAIMGIESLAQFMHEVEGRLDEGAVRLSTDDVQALTQRWADLGALSLELGAGISRGRSIAISVDEFEELLAQLQRLPQLAALAEHVASFRHEPAEARFERLRKQFQALSRKLGKGEPNVVIEPSSVRLPATTFAEFWAVLAHVVRNTVDHGFETPEERAAAGKKPENEVRLRAFTQGDRRVIISVSDDGRGIDWQRVAEKAAVAGLPSATPSDLEQALYADSLSTRDEVTETSGRGVGLGAVRSVVTSLGGYVEIESALGRGTTFRFVLPVPAAASRSSLRAINVTPSGHAPAPTRVSLSAGRSS
jgi:two-component system chemotaxis sensor kinase CheA